MLMLLVKLSKALACGSFSNFKVGQGILVTVTSPHIVNVKQMQNTPQKQNKKTTP